MELQQLQDKIRDIPDFPKKGILFRDITPLLADPAAFWQAIETMANKFGDEQVDVVVGIESRGFIFGAPLAYRLDAGFVPVRKLGKLPFETVKAEYDLEYGTNCVEIHKDAIVPGQKVLIVDDLLATGGTARATADLVRMLGGEIVSIAFLCELTELNGREKLDDCPVTTLIKY
jgi:adenine phosphoribosyltransferase